MKDKVKKPFYKRIWVWVIALLVIGGIASSQGSSTSDSSSSSSAKSSSVSSASSSSVTSQKWTLADYDALAVGDTLSGVGGANYDDIVAKFGKPDTSSDTQSGDYSMRSADWTSLTDGSVFLTFTKQADGTWLLSSKTSSDLK
ncbi:hypothetical protein ESZ50_10085 [Weissella muntiaci]|uniref:Uncharacterized protein n=1 Tax=Weissella muntiaci TaxID=2508881 RepID=A0A6C2C2U5_9LACO|nr:hypothetical protein [Weissella muntiaci]TYC48112.1 hypothetical protein ESZ50_10085 [Weissella muntiaci]